MERKFKVGDKVRVLVKKDIDGGVNRHDVGSIGVVECADYELYPPVLPILVNVCYGQIPVLFRYSEDELELVEEETKDNLDDLVQKTSDDIKENLYRSLTETFDVLDAAKHQLSCIYEGVANDLDIMKTNGKATDAATIRDLVVDIIMDMVSDESFMNYISTIDYSCVPFHVRDYIVNSVSLKKLYDQLSIDFLE